MFDDSYNSIIQPDNINELYDYIIIPVHYPFSFNPFFEWLTCIRIPFSRWGVEVLLHRYFASSACRTLNPEEAGGTVGPPGDVCQLTKCFETVKSPMNYRYIKYYKIISLYHNKYTVNDSFCYVHQLTYRLQSPPCTSMFNGESPGFGFQVFLETN